MIPENKTLSEKFITELKSQNLMQGEFGIAIIDLKQSKLEIFGYNLDHFIYPASIYKIFIGAEVLRRVELGEFALEQKIEIKSPNEVDKDAKVFPGDTTSFKSW